MPFIREEAICHLRVLVGVTCRVRIPQLVRVEFVRGSTPNAGRAGNVIRLPALCDKAAREVFCHCIVVKGFVHIRVLAERLSDVFCAGVRP